MSKSGRYLNTSVFEVECEVITKIKNKDKKQRHRVVFVTLPFAISIVKKYD